MIAYVLEFQHGSRDPCDVLHIFRTEHSRRLARLAEDTGGRVLEVRGRDRLQAAFEEIAEELHSQYSLGHYPTNQQWDSRFRRLEIRTQQKGYPVQARKGYYATPLVAR